MDFKAMSLVAAMLLGVVACDAQEVSRTGAPAPELAVLDREERVVKLADLEGKVVLVNFWLAECGPCLVEMPEFDEVYREHRDAGFEVLAVNMGQDEETIREVRRKLDVSYPLVSDTLKITTQRYGVVSAPTSFLVDREGLVHERIDAPLSKTDLEGKLAQLL